MTTPGRIGSLQIEEDLEFQRRSWIVQRVGWGLMGLLVIASAAGLFGSGPVSSAETRSAGGEVAVEYERFLRYDAPARLRIAVREAAPEGTIAVRLNREYLDAIKLEHVVPRPERVEIHGDSVVFLFRQANPGQPLLATFDYEAQRIGRLRARVASGAGASLGFGQLVYP
jgi:hypothetical protein